MISLRRKISNFAIRLQEAFVLAVRAMFANKMRTSLTLLGVIIGVGTVVGIVSLTSGLNNYIGNAFDFAGADSFMLTRFDFLNSDHENYLASRFRPRITPEDAWAIRDNCPSVGYTAPRMIEAGTLKYRDKTAENIYIVGTTEEFQNMEGLLAAEGRILLNSDVERARNICVLGYEAKKTLFGDKPSVGRRIKVNGYTYTVVGSIEPLGAFLNENRDASVLIPITNFQKYFASGNVNAGCIVIVKPKNPELQEHAIDEVATLMRTRHGLKANDEDDFYIMPQTAFMDAFRSLTGVIFVVVISVGAISLLVGGVGIMNIMLVSVSERTREVGLRKSLGARRYDIMLQFILEAVLISIVGGLLGVGLGALIANLVGTLTPLPTLVDKASIVLGITFSTAVGIFFGIYPARKASRLNPIEALRQN
ncbi:MAG: FtsX-like permease family protein [bacterium]|nr:FtsX-like permease family protein [bacterium]